MVLTQGHATSPGRTASLGTADDIQEADNQTTPFVDQNQTYTSHPSHQVFLREYSAGRRRPCRRGRHRPAAMIDGVGGGNIGNWAEVKAQAPRHARHPAWSTRTSSTCRCSRPTPTATSCAAPTASRRSMLATARLVSGEPGGADRPAARCRTDHEFLDDIAHNAVPTRRAPRCRQRSRWRRSMSADGPAGTYDDELLDRHFVTGDGRGNENIALTAVHTIFHSEHNRLRATTSIDGVNGLTASSTRCPDRRRGAAWLTTMPASGWDYGERAVPGGEVRHRDAVPAPRVRGVRAQAGAVDQRVHRRRHQLRERHQPGDRRRVRAPDLPPRPLDADRDDCAHRSERHDLRHPAARRRSSIRWSSTESAGPARR